MWSAKSSFYNKEMSRKKKEGTGAHRQKDISEI
jgi:hypothetical protein